jgi:RNA polymerase sigma factor (sigma-70 family)
MKATEDIVLINKIKKSSDSDALKELELKHSGICHQMIKKYYQNMIDFGVDPKDVAAEKLLIIYKSALNFNPDKNVKFSTWLGNQMRYHCLNTINSKNQDINLESSNLISLIEKKQSESLNISEYIKDQSNFIFEILSKMKDKRMHRIFKLRYFDNKKQLAWSKIAKKLNLSTQTVINLHEKGKILLKNKLTSINNNDII